RKARDGGLAGLLDPAIIKRKQAEEQKLLQAIDADPKLKDTAAAWKKIADAMRVRVANIQKYTLLEGGAAFNSKLFDIARTLVPAGEERPKANAERLPEFRDSNLESLQFALFSEEPLYDDFEQLKLANGLTWLTEQAGAFRTPGQNQPAGPSLVNKILAGKS